MVTGCMWVEHPHIEKGMPSCPPEALGSDVQSCIVLTIRGLRALFAVRYLISNEGEAASCVVWLARPSHLIAGALRAGKGRSSGSND